MGISSTILSGKYHWELYLGITKASQNDVAQFLQLDEFLLDNEYVAEERRSNRRYPLSVLAIATPLNENFEACAAPFNALTRDISAGGVGIVHSRPLTEKYITLDFMTPDGRDMHFTIKVLRCNQLLCGAEDTTSEDMSTYYESGGCFIINPRELT